MLLRNESKVLHSVHIKLVFDDMKMKELDIYETDYVRVDYRKNGCKESVTGSIIDIIPYVKSKCRCDFDRKESAIIKVDASKEFNSEVVAFDISDIIDITKLIPVHCCHCCCGHETSDNDNKGDEVDGQEET